jgi:hypothetical protein
MAANSGELSMILADTQSQRALCKTAVMKTSDAAWLVTSMSV